MNYNSHFWHSTSTNWDQHYQTRIRRGWHLKMTQDARPGLLITINRPINYFDNYLYFYLWMKSIISSLATWFANVKNKSSWWICGQLSMSNTSGLPWWIIPLQCSDWLALQDFILEETLVLTANITKPVNDTCSEPGHKYCFSLDVKYWVPPNGTQCIYGTSIWLWLSPTWLERRTVSTPWAQGHLQVALETAPVNLSLIWAYWFLSLFPQYDHLTMIFVNSSYDIWRVKFPLWTIFFPV